MAVYIRLRILCQILFRVKLFVADLCIMAVYIRLRIFLPDPFERQTFSADLVSYSSPLYSVFNVQFPGEF